MATLTELHRETRKIVRQAIIQGGVQLTGHGSVIARIEPEVPTVTVTLEEFISGELTGEAIAEAVREARRERDERLS